MEVRAGRLLTDVLSGGYRSTFRGMGVEFSDVREYVEGDDPRSVDWNVSARYGRPFVKRFVEERERTLVFVLDLSATMAAGLGAWSLRQAAARYCALLGLMAIDNHDRVGLMASGQGEPRFVLPQSGGGHVLRVIRDCVTRETATQMQVGKPGEDLARLLATVNARVRRRAVVFVMSDFAGDGYEHALSLAARRHDVVAMRFLGRERIDPPRRLLRARDPETSQMQLCDFASERFRQAWFERVQQSDAHHRELLGRSRMDGIDVEVPAEQDVCQLAKPLLAFFRRRQARTVPR